jgi:hypothetical protein
VIAILTAVNILVTSICSNRQLAILQANSNLEYRPYVFVDVIDENTALSQDPNPQGAPAVQFSITPIDSMRLDLSVVMVRIRNTGKGPAKEVQWGLYISSCAQADRGAMRQARTRRLSLPPNFAFTDVYGDTISAEVVPGDSARLYLHAFASYCNVAGRRFFTERVYEPDSFTRRDTLGTTSTTLHYLSSTIR